MLEIDALDGVITGVYSQKQTDREWYPIAYYLKTIVDTKLNYLIHDKEILAIISSF
jgi:RNase H-like domain found in reverse transcriptase